MPEEMRSENRLLSPPPPRHGPIAGIVIVILILLIGGLYFGVDRLKRESKARSQIPPILNSTTTLTIIVPSTSTHQ